MKVQSAISSKCFTWIIIACLACNSIYRLSFVFYNYSLSVETPQNEAFHQYAYRPISPSGRSGKSWKRKEFNALHFRLVWLLLSYYCGKMTRKNAFTGIAEHYLPCGLELKGIEHDEDACPYAHNFQMCDLCHVTLTTPGSANSHYKGKKHKQKILQAQAIEDMTAELKKFSGKITEHKRKQRNIDSRKHRDQAESDKGGIILTPTSLDLDFGILEPGIQEQQQDICIENKSSRAITLTDITIRSPTAEKVITLKQDATYYYQKISPGKLLKVTVLVKPKAYMIGVYEREFRFTFNDIRDQTISRFIKCIVGEKSVWEDLMPQGSEYKPFIPNRDRILNKNSNLIGGVRPTLYTLRVVYKNRLPTYPVDKNILETVIMYNGQKKGQQSSDSTVINSEPGMSTKKIIDYLRRGFLRTPMDLISYKSYWYNLLHLEETQMIVDIDQYAIENASITKLNKISSNESLCIYSISVPGLAEKRPSVVYRDRIQLRETKKSTTVDEKHNVWEGYAVEIRDLEVVIQLSKNFDDQFIKGQKYDVRFSFNRVPLRRMHSAIDGFEMSNPFCLFTYALQQYNREHRYINVDRDEMLSRLIDNLNNQKVLEDFAYNQQLNKNHVQSDIFDRRMLGNPEQLDAVAKIRFGQHYPMPFVLFGPPGTGKTMTLVESINQLRKNSENRILVCTPSNDAADIFVTRLTGCYDIRTMFRLNAITRNGFEKMHKDVQKHSRYDSAKKLFEFPILSELQQYRIIVSTCTTGGFPYELGVPVGFFTHIIIDEAGQAMDCEMEVAISRYVGSNTHVILAGDPRQLGPIIRSSLAKMFGLKTSFLENYMNMLMLIYETTRTKEVPDMPETAHARLAAMLIEEVPQLADTVSLLFTKLLQNYRSHEAIIKLPNQLFYNNQLKVCADPMLRNRFIGWSELPSPGYPIMFQHVAGKDEREGSSPSWFNVAEVNVVKNMVQSLKSARHGGFRPATDEDIGIITPYHRQVQKIRQAIRTIAPKIKVGSVETFQGQERPIIIISTVRSDKDYLESDARFNLGFVSDPKRFNVAITRAMSLLIVIGNCDVLWTDKNWRQLIEMLQDNNAITNWSGPHKNKTDSVNGDETSNAENQEDSVSEDYETIVYRGGAEDVEWVERE